MAEEDNPMVVVEEDENLEVEVEEESLPWSCSSIMSVVTLLNVARNLELTA